MTQQNSKVRKVLRNLSNQNNGDSFNSNQGILKSNTLQSQQINDALNPTNQHPQKPSMFNSQISVINTKDPENKGPDHYNSQPLPFNLQNNNNGNNNDNNICQSLGNISLEKANSVNFSQLERRDDGLMKNENISSIGGTGNISSSQPRRRISLQPKPVSKKQIDLDAQIRKDKRMSMNEQQEVKFGQSYNPDNEDPLINRALEKNINDFVQNIDWTKEICNSKMYGLYAGVDEADLDKPFEEMDFYSAFNDQTQPVLLDEQEGGQQKIERMDNEGMIINEYFDGYGDDEVGYGDGNDEFLKEYNTEEIF